MKVELYNVSRRPRWPLWAVLLVLLWLATGGTTIWLSNHLGQSVQLCLFRHLTGIPCPTCGFTHGVLSLLKGRPGQAWLYNPLLFSILCLFFTAAGVRILFARSVRFRLRRRERIIAWSLAATLFFINWAYVILYVG